MSTPAANPGVQKPLCATGRQRVLASLIAVGLLSGLVLASTLTPSHSGFGTHTQLGLPACGWLISTGYPCPTCGFTTAFAFAAQGEFGAAWRAQPAALLAAVLAASGFWLAVHVAVFGSRVGTLVAKLLTPWVLVPALVVFLAGWGWKMWTWHA